MVPAASRLGDRYRTLYPLGRGGMGTVELALDRGGDGAGDSGAAGTARVVALKRLLPEAKAKHAEMFLREARLAVLLRHPNVVHAFASGELGGELYMAMEYVEGEPLSRVVSTLRERGDRLAWPLVARLVADVADGLHAAHELVDEKGQPLRVVHRDVTPHNVMVAYDGHVKLLDFGVAKIEAEHGLTRTGEVKGKAAYMSPEQAMGDPLDRRSDLYSLGAVLFECLTGRRMWEGTDMEVMRKLALDTPPALLPLVQDAPPALARLYERLVARERDGRPESAGVVARELRAIADGHEAARSLPGDVELFSDSAKTRQAELERALAGMDEPSAIEVRRSREPPPGDRRRGSSPRADRSNARSGARPRCWRSAAWRSRLVLAVSIAKLGAEPRPRSTEPTPVATTEATAAPAPSPREPPTALPPTTEMRPAPSASASTAPSASAAPARPIAPATRPSAAKPVTVKPPPSASIAPPPKPLDVDPHAI
ncbi:MAG: serine/threonine-protein kinase [Polyangiaceae bacterium]